MAPRNTTRPDPMLGLALAAVLLGFISGTAAGIAGTLAALDGEQCARAADRIGCIIVTSER